MRFFSFHTYLTSLFIGFCYLIYIHGVTLLNEKKTTFTNQYVELMETKSQAQSEQMSLIRELSSLEDPEWIEWNLMEKLGLVPEGYRKVIFKDDSNVLHGQNNQDNKGTGGKGWL